MRALAWVLAIGLQSSAVNFVVILLDDHGYGDAGLTTGNAKPGCDCRPGPRLCRHACRCQRMHTFQGCAADRKTRCADWNSNELQPVQSWWTS